GQRQAGEREKDGGHSAQHDELALGEVNDVGSVVDEGEAQRDEGVDRPDRETGKEELQNLGHTGWDVVNALTLVRRHTLLTALCGLCEQRLTRWIGEQVSPKSLQGLGLILL